MYNLYIEKIVKHYNLISKKTRFSTILLIYTYIEKFIKKVIRITIKVFQKRIELLLYTSIILYIDVVHIAAKLSKYLFNLSPIHLAVVDRVILYLYTTRYLAI